jgi:hypothetical protein
LRSIVPENCGEEKRIELSAQSSGIGNFGTGKRVRQLVLRSHAEVRNFG